MSRAFHPARRLLLATTVLSVGLPACFLYPTTPDGSIDAASDTPMFLPDVPAVLNACTPEMFVDRSAPGADRNIYFGTDHGSPLYGFDPKCMVIAVGQSVTWNGLFSVHPLAPGSPSDLDAGSPASPIPTSPSGNIAVVTFPTAGIYPFYCQMHGASGMTGVVLVQ